MFQSEPSRANSTGNVALVGTIIMDTLGDEEAMVRFDDACRSLKELR